MENFTYDKNKNLQDNLNYIGLDLKVIPQFLKEKIYPEYTVSRGYDEHTYKVYKYIPIKDIQILLTDVSREDDLKKRYDASSQLIEYIIPNDDEKEKNNIFLDTVENLNKDEIEKTRREQDRIGANIPFRVKFRENYLWQIYYSESTNQYFMLFSTRSANSSKMLYLLKEQINNGWKHIYAPVTCLDYTEELLSKLDILDLEKYIREFTDNWPQIYEVFDRDNNAKLYISGESNVYEGIVVKYRIILDNKQQALEFIKLTRALFIMQNEMYSKYKFRAVLNEWNSLDFWYENIKITYEYLPKFISEEYNKISNQILRQDEELVKLNKKIQDLKIEYLKKEKEYSFKEKEISTYLKYRRTFFGKIRYYFKNKNKKTVKDIQEDVKETEKQTETESLENRNGSNFYTLDELKAIDKILSQKDRLFNSIKSDIKSLEIKVINLDKKIENAKIYIEKIDENSKSIFDFWKFTNKDEISLPEGKEENKEDTNFKLQRIFTFEETFEEFSGNMDALLRTEFTLEELNIIFAVRECENILRDINKIKNGNEDELQNSLDELKWKIKEEENKLGYRNFDVFGNIMENQSTIKVLGGKKHRENRKNVYKILNINESTTLEEYKEKLNQYIDKIDNAINKVNINYDITLYKSFNSYDDFKTNGYEIYSLNINEVLKENRRVLIKLEIKDYLRAMPYTNIVFYTDVNETLPIGMNCGEEILVNNNSLKFEMCSKKELLVNNYDEKDIDGDSIETNTIEIYEYTAYVN